MIIACEKCKLQYDVRSYPEGTRVQCRCHNLLTVPAHVIEAVRCPSCGGTADPRLGRCNFCHTMLSRRACPRCAAAVREEAKFCDQCGETLRPMSTEMASATAHDCPRCKVPLFAQTCAQYPVEVCAECLGMWIVHDVLEQIYHDVPRRLEPALTRDVQVAKPEEMRERLGQNAAAYIPCPSCGTMMNPVNYARKSGVIVDICRQHGVWFDADELNKILEFFTKGGARHDDVMAREKERIQAELRATRMAEAGATGQRMQTPTHGGLFGSAMRGFLLR
ncbi:MAG: zf-TFIIB domain-containing protein [Pseudomonadota bacterium]